MTTMQYDWVETNSPVASSRTDDIWFFDPQAGWLVNSNGQVCVTHDGGQTWEQKLFVPNTPPSRPYLRCVGFANRQKGWVGALTTFSKDAPRAYLQALLRTTEDGGATWRAVENLPEGSPEGICGLAVVNESVVYGSGSNDPARIGPGIIKTTDGGRTWALIDMRPYASNLIDIHFFDEQRGWVVGGKAHDDCTEVPPAYSNDPQYAKVKPVVLYTADGGKTWENRVASLPLGCGAWGWKIAFINERVGFVSLENFLAGAILKTLDGGHTWQQLSINDRRPLKYGQEVCNANLEGIGFINEQVGWVGGWGDANFIGTYNSVTQDGGQTWQAEDFAVNASLRPVGDLRLNANRFRFFGNPVNAGYCSGKKVYKLLVQTPGVAALTSAVPSTRVVPTTPGETALRLSAEAASPGHWTIHYTVSATAQRVSLGLWNSFGFHIRTLVDEPNVAPAQYSITWDGTDDAGGRRTSGAVICRLMVDNQAESLTIQLS